MSPKSPTISERKAAMLAGINGQVQSAITKRLGTTDIDDTVFIAAGNEHLMDFGVLPFGNPAIDKAIGGGAPRGVPIMISGEEGAGKTMSVFDLIAYNQKLDSDFYAMYMHLEARAFPLQGALMAGVDLQRLVVLNAIESAELTFGIAARYLWDKKRRQPLEIDHKPLIDVLIMDSVTAAASDSQITYVSNQWDTNMIQNEKDKSAGQPGRLAAMMSKFFMFFCGAGALGKTSLILISQLRTAVGEYNAPDKATGGNACKFYPKIHITMRKGGAGGLLREDGKKGTVIGHTVFGRVPKNNTCREDPHKEFEYKVYYGKGVDTIGPLIQIALERQLVLETSAGRYVAPVLDSNGVIQPARVDDKRRVISGQKIESITLGEDKKSGKEVLEEMFRTQPWFLNHIQNEVARQMTASATSAAPTEGANLEEIPENAKEDE